MLKIPIHVIPVLSIVAQEETTIAVDVIVYDRVRIGQGRAQRVESSSSGLTFSSEAVPVACFADQVELVLLIDVRRLCDVDVESRLTLII